MNVNTSAAAPPVRFSTFAKVVPFTVPLFAAFTTNTFAAAAPLITSPLAPSAPPSIVPLTPAFMLNVSSPPRLERFSKPVKLTPPATPASAALTVNVSLPAVPCSVSTCPDPVRLSILVNVSIATVAPLNNLLA